MSNIHEAIGETLAVKINEDGTFMSEETPAENIPTEVETANVPAEVENDTPPEITPELVAGLIAETPELEGIDADKLLVGMQTEMEHYETTGKDLKIIALIASAHIKEFPDADYYAALATMEDGLRATEEVPAEGTPVEEVPAPTETPAEEVPEAKEKGKSPSGTAKAQMKTL